MPAGHFDDHIAAIGAPKISEDYSEFIKCHDYDLIESIGKLTMPADDYIAAIDAAKIECYDRIKSIINLNARTDVCCLYSATTDVALLRLPPMINLEATKLHVSNSGHWNRVYAKSRFCAFDLRFRTVVRGKRSFDMRS
jgi:hypothetical protein